MTEPGLALAGIVAFTAAVIGVIGLTIRDIRKAQRNKRTNDRINKLP